MFGALANAMHKIKTCQYPQPWNLLFQNRTRLIRKYKTHETFVMCVELESTQPSTYVSNRFQDVILDIYCGSLSRGSVRFVYHLSRVVSCALQRLSPQQA